jgi:uncharacterized protein (TIGR03086 family)
MAAGYRPENVAFLQDGIGILRQGLAMSDIAARYQRLADDFAATVAAVPPQRWASPSPCEEWTARDVVRHVIDTHGMFLGLVARRLPGGPSVDDDPVGAFASASKAVADDLRDPDRANETFTGFFGETTFAESIDRFISGDLLVHRWDLSTAAGLDVRLDPEEIRRARVHLDGFGDALRGPGVCGPALEPPPGADAQAELIAFMGRRVPA